jgi:murein DD-endopeptidase MepM/ murein hydrolase activator NlpD
MDPCGRGQRFHQGVDLAAAYGQAVPAVAPGQVVFAGEQQGYGLTVVVQHAGGVTSRYGHLSSLDVRTGESVGEGTLVGRVGSSGRSTGTHLHFEVRVNGQPVDPERAASRYASLLKTAAADADSPNESPEGVRVVTGVSNEN